MMLNLISVSAERDERVLFSKVSAKLLPGEALHIVGANGAGKTTLLRMICGLTRPAAGHIEWDGRDIRQSREAFCTDLLYFGHRNANKIELSCRENLRASMGLEGGRHRDGDYDRALGEVGIRHLAHLPARFLSQGQQRRLAMARLVLSKARLWVLDEPYTALDTHAIGWLNATIEGHLANQGMVVLTSHQAPALNARLDTLALGRRHV